MKKVYTLSAITLASIALVACGNNNKNGSTVSSATNTSKNIGSNTKNSSIKTHQIHVAKNEIVNPGKGKMEILGFESLSYKGKPAYAVEWKFTNTSKKQLTADDIDQGTHTYFQKNGNSEKSISSPDVYILSADQANYDSVSDNNTDAYNDAVAQYNVFGKESNRSSEDKIEPGKSINLLGGELIIPVSKENIKVQVGDHNKSDTDVDMSKDNFIIKCNELSSKHFTNDLVEELKKAYANEASDQLSQKDEKSSDSNLQSQDSTNEKVSNKNKNMSATQQKTQGEKNREQGYDPKGNKVMPDQDHAPGSDVYGNEDDWVKGQDQDNGTDSPTQCAMDDPNSAENKAAHAKGGMMYGAPDNVTEGDWQRSEDAANSK